LHISGSITTVGPTIAFAFPSVVTGIALVLLSDSFEIDANKKLDIRVGVRK